MPNENEPNPNPSWQKYNRRRQGVVWAITIPAHCFLPYLPPMCTWISGQLESGDETGYLHWQLVVAFKTKKSVQGVREVFGPYHATLTVCSGANAYCEKEKTAIQGTSFELGCRPFQRNSKTDWDAVFEDAKSGDYSRIPAHVRVVNYRTLKLITLDYSKAQPMSRVCFVYWGPTHCGKSHTAEEEAGSDAFPKDPQTKFWDGYQGEENVTINEFRGEIGIAHLLRWTDRYALRLEQKHGGCVAKFRKLWITSNLHPRDWYPQLDTATVDALLRRLTIREFTERYEFPE